MAAGTGDRIDGTVGDSARNVAIGKYIDFNARDDSDMPDGEKLNEVYRLVYQISERVAVLYTWVIALTVVAGVVGLIALLQIY